MTTTYVGERTRASVLAMAAGGARQTKIAREVGVSHQRVHQIIHGRPSLARRPPRPAMTLWLENGDGFRRCRRCADAADYVINDTRSGSLPRTPVCRRHLRGALRERGELAVRETEEEALDVLAEVGK